MKVLFDHNVPRKLCRLLLGHEIRTAREMDWAELENGELLAAAEAGGFQVMMTADKNLSYQQNLENRTLSLVVLSANDWDIVKRNCDSISAAIDRAKPGSFEYVKVAV